MLRNSNQYITTLGTVKRKKDISDEARRRYATELIDTYYGFGKGYLEERINKTIRNESIKREMFVVARCLPLLQYFVNSISRVYSTQPKRKFFLDGKEIINETLEGFDNLDKNKFVQDTKLFDTLNGLYSDNVINTIKQSEKFTNLLNTTVYKVITNNLGKIELVFIPNDTIQIHYDQYDINKAAEIAFSQNVTIDAENTQNIIPLAEVWNVERKSVPMTAVDRESLRLDNVESENEAAIEYEKLYDNKITDYAFAPFAVFKDSGYSLDFWNQKNADVNDYIKSINMSLTELKYLMKYTSFGLKYTIGLKAPEDGVLDPIGIVDFAEKNSGVPLGDGGKNYDIGEFKNEGRMDEVIRGIIFDMKLLFNMFNIPLDALISTNSVRSAENKQMENEELFSYINAQRDIWTRNEQELFRVMTAVHNRDNDYQLPKGVEMFVNFTEHKSKQKEVEQWLVEIENNVSTVIDWLSEMHPDLDRDELMDLLTSNKSLNQKDMQQSQEINLFNKEDEEEDEEEEEETPTNDNNR